MKKLVYAAVVAFLFVGGLAAGVIHKGMQKQKSGEGPVIGGPVMGGDAAVAATETPGLSLADLSSTTTEGLPADGSATPAVETLSLDAATPAPLAAGDPPDSGRVFGGSSDPVDSGSSSSGSRGSSGSSGSSSSSMSSFSSDPVAMATPRPKRTPKENFGGGSIPDNFEDTSVPTVIEEPAWDAPKKSGKTSVAAAPTEEPDVSLDELPTIDDSGNFTDSSAAGDPFDSAPTPAPAPVFDAPTPAPPPAVAFSAPSGGGDLVFGASSKRPALARVSQKQNGAGSTVSIELAGSAPYKIIHMAKRRQVWVDFEGAELPPGARSSVQGTAPNIREISAKYYGNPGGTPIARIIVQLDDGVMTTNDRGKEALVVSPGASTGQGNRVQLQIGGKSQQF